MVEHVLELLESLAERERTVNKIIEVLGADENAGFLTEELEMAELLLVEALGGNEGHHAHVGSTDLFYNYCYTNREDSKQELVDYIRLTIKNDWKGETLIEFSRD